MKKRKSGDIPTKFISHFFLIIFSLLCFIPFLIILGSSFESQKQIMSTGYTILPKSFSLEAYKAVLGIRKRLSMLTRLQ